MYRSHGGAVTITDLTAAPKIDRDNPPDLKQLADNAAVMEALKVAASPAAAVAAAPAAGAAGKAVAVAGSRGPAAVGGLPPELDVTRIVQTVISRVRNLVSDCCIPFPKPSSSLTPLTSVIVVGTSTNADVCFTSAAVSSSQQR
jgi:hypothetical protein